MVRTKGGEEAGRAEGFLYHHFFVCVCECRGGKREREREREREEGEAGNTAAAPPRTPHPGVCNSSVLSVDFGFTAGSPVSGSPLPPFLKKKKRICNLEVTRGGRARRDGIDGGSGEIGGDSRREEGRGERRGDGDVETQATLRVPGLQRGVVDPAVFPVQERLVLLPGAPGPPLEGGGGRRPPVEVRGHRERAG